MRIEKSAYEELKDEQIRLVSKKHVEGINRREQEQLDRICQELLASSCAEKVVEFDYYY